MSGSRWNRRETNVAQAGYFTVLRSSGFFSALGRLPGGYRYLVKGPATPDVLLMPEGMRSAAPERGDEAQGKVPAFETLTPKSSGLSLLRVALIGLVAAGLTALFFLLLHLDSPGG